MADPQNTIIDPILKSFVSQSYLRGQKSSRVFAEDPTVMGFSLVFYFDDSSPLLNKESNKGESALRYLKNLGEDEAYDCLARFQQLLFEINQDYSYFFQNLKGLEDIMDFHEDAGFHERTITVETLESIDLRIANLSLLYKKFTYDKDHQRFILPENLRYFKFGIIVQEIRNIKTFFNKVAYSSYEELIKNLTDLDEYLTFFHFEFDPCLLNFNKSNPFLEEIKNDDIKEPVGNSFSIDCGKLHHRSEIRDYFKLSEPPKASKDPSNASMKDRVKQAFERSKNTFLNDNKFFVKSENVLFGRDKIDPLKFLQGRQPITGVLPQVVNYETATQVTAAIILTQEQMSNATNKINSAFDKFIPNFNNDPIKGLLNYSANKGVTNILGKIT